MEDTPWEQRLQALTHVLTSPTTKPSLHSQFLIATQIPRYLHRDSHYPPILRSDSTAASAWPISFFLRRIFGLGPPQTSWRCKCPYQQPPPLVLAEGVEEARWGLRERREWVRGRMRRKRLGCDVSPWIPLLVPNLLLFSLLLWNPFPEND